MVSTFGVQSKRFLTNTYFEYVSFCWFHVACLIERQNGKVLKFDHAKSEFASSPLHFPCNFLLLRGLWRVERLWRKIVSTRYVRMDRLFDFFNRQTIGNRSHLRCFGGGYKVFPRSKQSVSTLETLLASRRSGVRAGRSVGNLEVKWRV